MTKIIRIHYDVDTYFLDVRMPSEVPEEDYDDWFDVVNSKVDVTHSYEEVKLAPGVEHDWDLTEG